MVFVGLLVAAGGFVLVSRWTVGVLAARHNLGLFTLPVLDTDLALVGLGLGVVIGPLTSAALRAVPPREHGIASAAVVVSRMIGMLIGIAALGAWGFYRFNQHLATLAVAHANPNMSLIERLTAQAARYREAYVMMYGDIFLSAAIVCIVGALLGLLIAGRHEHAEELPAGSDAPDARHAATTDAAATELISTPPQAIDKSDDHPGRHRSP
jgi:hypothetical protein